MTHAHLQDPPREAQGLLPLEMAPRRRRWRYPRIREQLCALLRVRDGGSRERPCAAGQMRNARGGRRRLSPWLLGLALTGLLVACEREPSGVKRQGSSDE